MDQRRLFPKGAVLRSWRPSICAQLATWPEGVRDGRPGLQAHTPYLAKLGTRTDQKLGRGAFERLAAPKKDYARLGAEADRPLDQ